MENTFIHSMLPSFLAAALLLAPPSAWSGTVSSGPRYEPFEVRPMYPQVALTNFQRGCVLLETGLHCWTRYDGDRDLLEQLGKIRNITQIIGMHDALCVLADGMVHCLDREREIIERRLPDVSNATMLVPIGKNDFCATTPSGLRCSGKTGELFQNALELLGDRTRKIFKHDGMACVVRAEITSEKACRVVSGFDWSSFQFVKYRSWECDEVCYWGSETINQASGPGIGPILEKSTYQVLNDHCVATQTGAIGCFTAAPAKDVMVGWDLTPFFRPLQSVKIVKSVAHSVYGGSSCAITDRGVECWEYNKPDPLYVPSGISNPRQLVSTGSVECVLDDKGVLCWDPSHKDNGQRLTNSAGDPSSILAASFRRVCLLDEQGIRCWDDEDRRNQISFVPARYGAPSKEIQELIQIRRLAPEALAETLPRLGEEVYAEKRAYLTSLATALKDLEKEYGAGMNLEAVRLFTFFALEPIVTQLDSAIFTRSHIPNYKRMQERLGKEKGISNLSQVPASVATVRMAARTLHAVLSSTSRFWNSENATQNASDLQRKLGVFLAKQKPNAIALQDLVQDLQESHVFESLVPLPRTKSLGLAAGAIIEWLAGATD